MPTPIRQRPRRVLGWASRMAGSTIRHSSRAAVATGLAIAAMIGVGTSTGTSHHTDHAQRALVQGCVSTCSESAADPSRCQSYCGCMADTLLAGHAGVTVDDIPNAETDPAVRQRLERIRSACVAKTDPPH